MTDRKRERPNAKYLHTVSNVDIADGEKTIYEETITEREDGMVILKYFLKNKSGWEKIVIVGKDDDYKMKIMDNKGRKDESTLSKSELKKFVGKDKNLKFAKKFVDSKGGKRRC